jgi:hypothetical protein
MTSPLSRAPGGAAVGPGSTRRTRAASRPFPAPVAGKQFNHLRKLIGPLARWSSLLCADFGENARSYFTKCFEALCCLVAVHSSNVAKGRQYVRTKTV